MPWNNHNLLGFLGFKGLKRSFEFSFKKPFNVVFHPRIPSVTLGFQRELQSFIIETNLQEISWDFYG